VEAIAESGGQVVEFVGAVNFDGFLGGIEDHLAVPAAMKMGFELGTRLRSHCVVD
jgi:hypothetical protein